MTPQPRMVFVAAIISLALHAALVMAIYDRPMGQIDPALFDTEQVYRVYRSLDDLILPDPLPDAAEPLDEEALAYDLTQMSLALLDQASPLQDVARETAIALREQAEEREVEAVDTTLPVELPDGITDSLIGPPPDSALGFGGDGGAAAESASAGDVTIGSGAARAQALLREGGFVPVHDPLPAARPQAVEFTPADVRIVDAAPAQPPIDFASIALENTTQLHIPEHLDHDFDYNITVHHDTRARGGPRKYFQIDIAARRSLTKLPAMPKDVIFLIDVSGSVPQMWVNQVAAGVRESLSSLNEYDRFNIVLFNDRMAPFSESGPVPATEDNITAARAFVSDARSHGWTDVNRVMGRLLVRDTEIDRVYNLILISDGVPTRGVTDTRELINIITRDNDFISSIYCVGVGRPQNRELLDFLSYRNKGFSVHVGDHTEAAAAIRNLVSRIRYPIIKDVRLSTVGLDGQEVYPVDLPNIHQGERFSVFGTFDDTRAFTMRVTGVNSLKPLDFTHTFDLVGAPQGDAEIAKQWAFWKLHHLYSRIIQEGERRSIVDEIRDIQRRYGLRTLY